MSETRFATCMLCEASCGIAVTVEDDRGSAGSGPLPSGARATRIQGDRADTFSRGHVCPKATALDDVRLDPDRVRAPRVDGRDAGWDQALDRAAERLARVVRDHGRDAVAVYTGNPTAHNTQALLGALTLFGVLGTRSRFSATSVDQLPHMLVSLEMFGHQALLPVPDIDRTRYFLCIGANPLVSGGSLMTAPGIARRFEELRARGGKLVVVDPRRTETARAADEHLFIRPGTDALLLMAMVRTLFEDKRVKLGRLEGATRGAADLERACEPFAPERVAAATGIDAADIRRLARDLSDADGGVVYGRVGVCQQEFGAVAAWLVVAVNALTGNLDRAGGAMFTTPAVDLLRLASLLGQRGSFGRYKSRVRGLPEFGGELPTACLAEEIEAGHIRALVTIAGNPVLSLANGARIERALSKLDTIVSIDVYANETTRHAHVLLPSTFGLEREHFDLAINAVAVRNVARWAEPVFDPLPGVRNDWDILIDLACRVGPHVGLARGVAARAARRLGWKRALDLALRAGPYRTSLRELQGRPHGTDFGPLAPRLPAALHTPDRRIHLAPARLLEDVARLRAKLDERVPNGDSLLLIGRRVLRSNNSWMHNSHRLVKGRAACTLLMHPSDAADRGLSGGMRVAVESRVGAVRVPLEVTDDVAPGVVSLPHGYGHERSSAPAPLGRAGSRDGAGSLRVAREQAPGASINDITDDARVDALSGNAAFSGTPVTVRRVQ